MPRAPLNNPLPWQVATKRQLRFLLYFFNRAKLEEERRYRSRRRYVYSFQEKRPEPPRKRLKERFVDLRLVKLFYLTLKYRQFRRIARAAKKRKGNFEENYCLALECRMVSFLYRTSLVSNMFQCIQLVKAAALMVDFKLVNHVNSPVRLGQLVAFNSYHKRIVYICLLKRLRRQASVFNVPTYMFVSYPFLFAFLKRFPRQDDLVFPISMDMYRATGYISGD